MIVDNIVDRVDLYTADSDDYARWTPNLFDSAARDFWSTIDVHINAFVDALVDEREPPVTGRDGARALRLTYAAITSFESGAPVRI